MITAGVHGCEYVGIEAAKRIGEFIDPAGTGGKCNIDSSRETDGFFDGRKQVVPEDGKNLNRVFPGTIEWNDC